MRVGYARASSRGQRLDYQLDRLKDCEKVFSEKESAKVTDRPQLEAAITYLREGDVLVITKLDRAGRSIRHLLEIVDRLEKKGCSLEVLDQNVTTSTAIGRLLFGVLALIAEFENEIKAERVRDGLAAAKARGLKTGPAFTLSERQIEELHAKREAGASIGQLAKEFKLSSTSIYRYLSPTYARTA